MTTATTCWKCCAELPSDVIKATELRKDARCPSCGSDQCVDVIRKGSRVTVVSRKAPTEFEKAEARFWAAYAIAKRELAECQAELAAIDREHDELRKMLDEAKAHIAKWELAYAHGERWSVDRRWA